MGRRECVDMKFIELWKVLDKIHPLWINCGDDCEYYENKSEISDEYDNRIVEYITLDGDGVLTIELIER